MIQHRLTDHLTTWRAWYAVLAVVAVILGSSLQVVGDLGGWSTPATFVALAVLALLFLTLVDTAVSIWGYLLVFTCPIWVFLIARGLYSILPKGQTTA